MSEEEKDDFGSAFDEATGVKSQEETEDKEDKEEELGEKEEVAESDKESEEEPIDVEQLKKEAEEAKKKLAEETQRRKSLEGMYNSDQETKKKLSEELENLKKKGSEEKAEGEGTDPDLEEYIKEYDYIAKNEAKLRSKELKKLKDDIVLNISEMLKVPFGQVEKVVGQYESDAADRHRVAVQEAHPDFGTAFKKDDIISWVETLPSGVKKAYTEIANSGSTEDVIFLMSEYKRVQGIQTPEDGDAGDDGETEKDNGTGKRLKKMEAVITKKKAVSGSSGKALDYEGAWQEANK